MINYEEIEPYLLDFLQGRAEEGMEYRIRAYLQQNPDFEQELEEMRETIDWLEASPMAEPAPSLKMEFYAMLQTEQEKALKIQNNPSIWKRIENFLTTQIFRQSLAFASVVLILVISSYYALNIFNQNSDNQQDISLHKDKQEEKAIAPTQSEKPLEEKEIATLDTKTQAESEKVKPSLELDKQEVVALNAEIAKEYPATHKLADFIEQQKAPITSIATTNLAKDIPSPVVAGVINGQDNNESAFKGENERKIEEIYAVLNQVETNEQTVNQLINTLNRDPNPNVRMAAADVLEQFVDASEVKELIAESLNQQNSPILQITTLDLIVKYEIKSATESIKELLNKPKLHAIVREQAEIALETM